jgi:hypothetical protein
VAEGFRFDPDRVAYFEAEGWRAYYDRRWPRVFRLMAQLCEEQFRIPSPTSWLAAYYVARGSLAWVPEDHDEAAVRRYLEKFYRIARRYSGLRFDPARAGELELRYFDDHRRFSGREEKGEYLRTMTELHATVFGLTPEEARESAEWRVRATATVDRITGKTSTDVEGDWAKAEDELRQCYHSIARNLAARSGAATAAAAG